MDALLAIVVHFVATTAAVFGALLLLSILVEVIWQWARQLQQARRARAEAELEQAERELHETILRLAEALTEERVAAKKAQWEMGQVASMSCRRERTSS